MGDEWLVKSHVYHCSDVCNNVMLIVTMDSTYKEFSTMQLFSLKYSILLFSKEFLIEHSFKFYMLLCWVSKACNLLLSYSSSWLSILIKFPIGYFFMKVPALFVFLIFMPTIRLLPAQISLTSNIRVQVGETGWSPQYP